MLNNLTKKKISVIIPLYNNERYIINCIESVIKQKYDNIEIIIVDDGSTDNSYNLVKEKYRGFKNIVLMTQKNQGPSVARNRGISHATGEWILFLDSDDELVENALNTLVLNSQKSDLVIGGWNGIYSNRIEYYGPSNNKQMNKSDIYDLGDYLISNGLLYKSDDVCIPSIEGPVAKLYSAKIIKENKIVFPSNLLYAEDVVFNYSYIQHCEHINTINKSVYNASRHSDSLSNRRIDFIEVYSKFKKIINENNYKGWEVKKALKYREFVWLITFLENEIKNIKIRDFKKYIEKEKISNLKGLDTSKLSRLKKIEYRALNSGYLNLYVVLKIGMTIKLLKQKVKYGRNR